VRPPNQRTSIRSASADTTRTDQSDGSVCRSPVLTRARTTLSTTTSSPPRTVVRGRAEWAVSAGYPTSTARPNARTRSPMQDQLGFPREASLGERDAPRVGGRCTPGDRFTASMNGVEGLSCTSRGRTERDNRTTSPNHSLTGDRGRSERHGWRWLGVDSLGRWLHSRATSPVGDRCASASPSWRSSARPRPGRPGGRHGLGVALIIRQRYMRLTCGSEIHRWPLLHSGHMGARFHSESMTASSIP
jgi:hypothetical protein